MNGAAAVRVRGLRYQYPDGTAALAGIDFDLAHGETVALLGPNGSGKTTFLLHLNGILRGTGEITVCGLPVTDETLTAIRRKVGFLFPDPDDQLFLPTVVEDVAFGPLQMGCTPAAARELAERALAQVDLPPQAWPKPPYHLSAGEKEKAALAGVLAMEPELLVLDEPTTHLDPRARRRLIGVLRALPQAKLLVTHDAALARALASRAVFFESGQIAAAGPVDPILAQFNWE